MNLWRLTGVLCLIGAEAFIHGYSYPLFSLALENRDLAISLIGLNASFAGAGALIVGPFLPRLIASFGLHRLVSAFFAISVLSFATILVADYLVVWFAARLVLGACFAALWITTEIWLNGIIDEGQRGRIIGASGSLYAVFQFFGPLALGGAGVAGSLPLIIAIVPMALCAVLANSIKPIGGAGKPGKSIVEASSFKLAFTMAGGLVAAAFLSGIGKTAMLSLLPAYGLAHGLNVGGAVSLVAAFILGEVVLIAGLGWMADRYGRYPTLRTCAVVAIVTSAALPFATSSIALLWPLLFFAGGTIGGIFTLGIILIGRDFRGQRMAAVSAGLTMAYSAGAIAGPALIGYFFDIFGPEALPVSLAIAFFGMAIHVFLSDGERRRDDESSTSLTMPTLRYLEDSYFDEEEPENSPTPLAEARMRPSTIPHPESEAFRPQKTAKAPSNPSAASVGHQGYAPDLSETFRQRANMISKRPSTRR
jgi:MFS family permease